MNIPHSPMDLPIPDMKPVRTEQEIVDQEAIESGPLATETETVYEATGEVQDA